MVNIDDKHEVMEVILPSGTKNYRETLLPNGMLVMTGYMPPELFRDVVDVHLFVGSGNWHDPKNMLGLAHMVEHMSLERSTRLRTRQEISENTRRYGSYVDGETCEVCTRFDLWTPDQYLFQSLPLFFEQVLNTSLVQRELETEVGAVMEEIRRTKADPVQYAELAAKGRLFKKNPFAFYGLGSLSGVQRITIEDCLKFREAHYHPANMTLTVNGPYDYKKGSIEDRSERFHDDVISAVNAAFDGMMGSRERVPHEKRTAKIVASHEEHLRRNIPNTFVNRVIQDGDFSDEHGEISVELLANILSNRIYTKLRDESGLTYRSVYNYTAFPEFVVSVGTSCHPRNFSRLAGIIAREEDSVRERIPEQEFKTEVDRLKILTSIKYANGQGKTREQINRRLGYGETFESAMKTLDAITPGHIVRAAQHVLAKPYAQITLGQNPLGS